MMNETALRRKTAGVFVRAFACRYLLERCTMATFFTIAIPSLITTLIALAGLAYKNPKAFKILGGVIQVFLFFVFIILATYQTTLSQAEMAVLEIKPISYDAVFAAQKSIKSIELPTYVWGTFTVAELLFLLVFLFPALGISEKEK